MHQSQSGHPQLPSMLVCASYKQALYGWCFRDLHPSSDPAFFEPTKLDAYHGGWYPMTSGMATEGSSHWYFNISFAP